MQIFEKSGKLGFQKEKTQTMCVWSPDLAVESKQLQPCWNYLLA